MPEYTFICDNCGEVLNYDLRINDPRPEIHESCGGSLSRDFSGVRINADQGKSDPKSSMFWKRGKSDNQIANLLNSNQSPY